MYMVRRGDFVDLYIGLFSGRCGSLIVHAQCHRRHMVTLHSHAVDDVCMLQVRWTVIMMDLSSTKELQPYWVVFIR